MALSLRRGKRVEVTRDGDSGVSAVMEGAGTPLFRRPYSETAPDQDQLTHVVGVMVGDQEDLT